MLNPQDSTISTQPRANSTIQNLFDLSGRIALVTGACGHLGRALSFALAEAGATVVVSSRSKDKADNFAAELGGLAQGKHIGIGLDHLEETSIESGFSEIIERLGSIDVLVNNGHFPLGKDLTEVSGQEFQQQLGNASAYFLLARRLRDWAVENNKTANIIMLGSMYGLVGSYPETYQDICPASPVAYHTLKGGIIHMTRHLAVYWAKHGIRVNCLSPGPFPGPQAPQKMVEQLCKKSPMARMGIPTELKGAVIFLASDASSYMTGQNLIIDGGWTAW